MPVILILIKIIDLAKIYGNRTAAKKAFVKLDKLGELSPELQAIVKTAKTTREDKSDFRNFLRDSFIPFASRLRKTL